MGGENGEASKYILTSAVSEQLLIFRQKEQKRRIAGFKTNKFLNCIEFAHSPRSKN